MIIGIKVKCLIICAVLAIMSCNCIFATSAEEDFYREYDEYWNKFYEDHGYNGYEDYKDEYDETYNQQNSKNEEDDYSENYDDNYGDDYDSDVKDYTKESKSSGVEDYNLFGNRANSSINSLSDNQVPTLLPFQGKMKESCQEEEYIYRTFFYLKPLQNDFCSLSKYYYDDTKIVYYYPIYSNDSGYRSFFALNQDNLVNCDNAVLLLDFIQCKQKEDGTWINDYLTKTENG